MSEKHSIEEIVRWHLETAKNALAEAEKLVEEEANLVEVRNVARLVSEHMEGLEFEYGRLCERDE